MTYRNNISAVPKMEPVPADVSPFSGGLSGNQGSAAEIFLTTCLKTLL